MRIRGYGATATELFEQAAGVFRLLVTRNCGQVLSEQAALKVLYLAVRNMEEFRSPGVGIRSSGGNRRCKRSRSTSTGESQPP